MHRRLIVVLLFATSAFAQERRGWGYAFAGPGVTSPEGIGFFHAGAGGEGLLYKGLGLGGEIGVAFPFESAESVVGIGSITGSYHFARDQKVVPFVAIGPAIGFREGAAAAVALGGGATWWFRDRLGLRLEVRDHFRPDDGSAFHLIGFRVGISFR